MRSTLIAIFITAVLAFFATLWYQNAEEPSSLNERYWGIVTFNQGRNIFRPTGKPNWEIARENLVLTDSDVELRTPKRGFLHINLREKRGRVELAENSSIRIQYVTLGNGENECRVSIEKGEVFIRLYSNFKSSCKIIEDEKVVAEFTDVDATFGRYKNSVFALVSRGSVTSGNQSVVKDQILELGNASAKVDQSPFSVLTPFPNDMLYISRRTQNRVRFAWGDIPKGYEMDLEVSSDGRSFKSVWKDFDLKGSKEAYHTFDPGVWSWRLVAKKGKSRLSTPTYYLFLFEESAPIPLTPSAAQLAVFSPERPRIRFHWRNNSRLENLILEISKSADFSSNILSTPVGNFDFFDVDGASIEGDVYWRVSGFPHDSSEVLTSDPILFSVRSDSGSFPPFSSRPASGVTFYSQEVREGELVFSWAPIGNVDQFRVHLSGEKQEEEILFVDGESRVVAPFLKPGNYVWYVEGKIGSRWVTLSEKKDLFVKDIETFPLKLSKANEVKWKSKTAKGGYKVRVTPISVSLSVKEIKTRESRVRLGDLDINTEVTNQIRVFALSSSGDVEGVSPALWVQPDDLEENLE